MRGLNDRFIFDLNEGCLSFFLNEVKANKDTCLAIRNGYINIYYRGGNALKITQKKNGYQFFFDAKYCLNKNNDKNYELLNTLDKKNIEYYIKHFKTMLCEMDSWFAFHPKAEREFQHNLLKSNSSIIDIEYQVKNISRLDMIAFFDKKLIIIENKFGNGAISGSAGISKHYKDITDILFDSETKEELISSVINISYAKHSLGLSDFIINQNDIKDVEILFLFANYNQKSKAIENEVELIEKSIPIKILYMDKNDYLIAYNNAKDLFCYGN